MENKLNKIETLKQITEVVNANNFENFIIDFKNWLSLTLLEKQLNGLKEQVVFHWIDDGKNDIKLKIKIVSH